MGFQEWKNRLMSLFAGSNHDGSRRPDGGTSCYRPVKKKGETGENQAQEDVPYIHTGFTGMNPPPEYGAPVQQPSGPYFQHAEEMPRNNISYMPGVMPPAYAPDAGNSYTHVEHIMTLTSLRSCYEAIECMKNGETLIITLDAIANEGESMRCQDMLAGAAFTLGCNVRMLEGNRLVLIAPESVKILPEQPVGRTGMNPPMAGAARADMNPPMSGPAPVQQQPVYSGRRERRVSQRSAQWEAARRGEMPDYNPYTGTAPVAAGAYGSFGGYGY